MELIPIKSALISISDKTGIIELAKILKDIGCQIISTGGTGKKITEAGIDITEISAITGNPEAFGGRMKTISFNIESALLFDREKDKEEAQSLGIAPIDLVVCNLYPFQKVLEQGADFETLIENIDIGGPTMIRAAAKNFKYVTVVTNPSDYALLIEELQTHNGAISYETRKRLMTKAFNHTADYDALIASTMDKENSENSYRLQFEKGYDLRYGENSHQSAQFYKQKGVKNSLFDLEILHGKALSFNNILDINGALETIKNSPKEVHACSVIKHSNPCGFCEGPQQLDVLKRAWSGDPISAFGSIIAFNQELELATVEFFQLNNKDRSQRKFVEVVIAPDFSEEALAYLQFHKNLRILKFDASQLNHAKDIRYLNGSLLVQDTDDVLYEKLDIVTRQSIDLEQDKKLIEFGLRAIQNIKSNSIAIVRDDDGYQQLLGMGAGQPNRLVATQLAIEKATNNLKSGHQLSPSTEALEEFTKNNIVKSYLISDAFFPFADNVELAAKHGIRKIIQPGGSIRDKEVIDACNELGVTMIFTGTRHFKH